MLDQGEVLARILVHVERDLRFVEVGRWALVDVELHTHVRGLVDRADGDVVFGVLPFMPRALEVTHQ